MVWPIPVLPANRANDTAQFDTHPADHNALADAVNELAKVTGRDLYYRSDGSSYQSGDITTTPLVIATATLSVVANHLYDVRAFANFVFVAGASAGVDFGLNIDGTARMTQSIFLPAANAGIPAGINYVWLAPSTKSGVVFNVAAVKSWWSTPAVRVTADYYLPRYLAVFDRGLKQSP